MGTMVLPETLAQNTVFTFTYDFSSLGNHYRWRKPGTHYVFGQVSESQYTFSAWNTVTGRWEDMMNEDYILDSIRVIGVIEPDTECECECHGDPVE